VHLNSLALVSLPEKQIKKKGIFELRSNHDKSKPLILANGWLFGPNMKNK
jgi:hypothetical protein